MRSGTFIFYFTTCFFILFISCKKKSQVESLCIPSTKQHSLVYTREISIPTGPAQYAFWFTSSYYEGDRSYFFGLSPNNSLEIYDLSRGNHLKTLRFEGPDAIYMTDFYVHSLDSIFVYSHDDYLLFLTDSSGVVKEKFRLNTKKTGELHEKYSLEGLESIRARISYDAKSDLFYFPVVPAGDFGFKEFYDKKFIMVYSLTDMDFIDVIGKYPNEYGSDLITHLTPDGYSITPIDSSRILLNFFQSPYIYVYNWREDSFEEAYCLKSKLFDGEFLEVSGDFNDTGMMIRYVTQANRFGALHKHKDGYFLIYKDIQDYFNSDGTSRDVFDSQWSIIMLDENLRKSGEHVFQGGKYFFYTVLPTNEGILISKDHVYHNENDVEDALQFDLYEIK